MKKFITLEIANSGVKLINLLAVLKESHNSIFSYQKKLTEDYAKNIFVNIENVACFKAKRKSLFESNIWLLVNNGVLTITNITSAEKPQLGIVDYNFVLNSFLNDFIIPNIDETFSVNVSVEEQLLQNILDTETFEKLDLWERLCNKDMPIAHPLDYKRWIDFVITAHNNNCELSSQDLCQWLIEDRHWSHLYNDKITELSYLYEYGIDILNAVNNENR